MTTRSPRRQQQGMATLIIVALLFFVLSLVAAYTNRNMIFEQRTSANQYRATQAFEAAEAGLDWALALLNTGRIDDQCEPSADLGNPSFRERYLDIDGDNGLIEPAAFDAAGLGTVWPSCVFDGNDWNCSCPAAGAAAIAAPVGAGPFPAFRVRFARISTTQPGIVRIDVNGCTRLDNDCLNFPSASLASEGRAMVSSVVALRSALPALPIAALTAREGVDVGGQPLGAFNSEPLVNGIAILAGGAVVGFDPAAPGGATLRLGSVGGTPGELAVIENDAALQGLGSADRFFESMFAAYRNDFREQPAMLVLDDCAGTCTAADIRTTLAEHPGRPIWVVGDVDFDSAGPVGDPNAPALVIATGSITFSTPVEFYGVLYSQAATWATSGAGQVIGAGIAEGAVGGDGSTTFAYDREVLLRTQFTTGSFVRVPGGWSDFRGF